MKTELDNRLSMLLEQVKNYQAEMKVSFNNEGSLFQLWNDSVYIALNFWSPNVPPDIYDTKKKLLADDYELQNKIQPEAYQPLVDIIKLVK